MNAAAEFGRNPVSKHQIQPEYGDVMIITHTYIHTYMTAHSGPVCLVFNSLYTSTVSIVETKIRAHLDFLSIPRLWGKKCQNV